MTYFQNFNVKTKKKFVTDYSVKVLHHIGDKFLFKFSNYRLPKNHNLKWLFYPFKRLIYKINMVWLGGVTKCP